MPKAVDRGIYAVNNPYGYQFNVNHPVINEIYKRYKAQKGLPSDKPMSDVERRRFDWYVQRLIDGGVLVVR